MLSYRILSALIMIPAVIAALFLLPPTGFALAIVAVCMLAAWEWGQFAGLTKQSHRIALAFACGIALIFMLKSTEGYSQLLMAPVVEISLLISLGWWLAATGLVLTYPKSANIWNKSFLIRILFGAFILVPFFWGMVTLRQYGYSENSHLGAWWLLYVMVLIWSADSGAYVFGRLFGKHKLAPKVSPGKTWEGVLGGLATAALMAWLFNCFVPLSMPVPMSTLLLCSVIAVVASILGDLTESMFKREAGIKDSSHLIPGHGGILDRIDSLTAAVSVFAALILLVFKP